MGELRKQDRHSYTFSVEPSLHLNSIWTWMWRKQKKKKKISQRTICLCLFNAMHVLLFNAARENYYSFIVGSFRESMQTQKWREIPSLESEGTVEMTPPQNEHSCTSECLSLPRRSLLANSAIFPPLLLKPPNLCTAHCWCEYLYSVLPRYFSPPCKSIVNDLNTKVLLFFVKLTEESQQEQKRYDGRNKEWVKTGRQQEAKLMLCCTEVHYKCNLLRNLYNRKDCHFWKNKVSKVSKQNFYF